MSKQPLAIRWRIALRDDDRPSRSAKLLGLTLATYADNRTNSTFVGLSTLARNCGFSFDTASRARGELRGHGYLKLTYRPGLTSIATLSEPPARVQGVRRGNPPQERPVTPRMGAGVTLNNSDGGAANGSAPLDECNGCGSVRPLVDVLALYCKDCAE